MSAAFERWGREATNLGSCMHLPSSSVGRILRIAQRHAKEEARLFSLIRTDKTPARNEQTLQKKTVLHKPETWPNLANMTHDIKAT